MSSLLEHARQQAVAELAAERHRALVEQEKRRLLEQASRKWWHKIVPFVIKIERRK